jgi:uncharacterized spore protein YtfJ
MKYFEALERTQDSMTVRRVFSEPVERDGVTIVPAAAVRGGGGGGGGEDMNGNQGGGAGFGLSARPVGAYQIKDGVVTWVPALDLTRVIVLGQVVAIIALMVVRTLVRRLVKKG